MRREAFGVTKKGESAWLYSLENRQGLKAQVTDYGAALVRMMVPDRDGRMRDVVLGYGDVSGYEKGTCFFGATVGRCANRIRGGSTLHAMQLDGKHIIVRHRRNRGQNNMEEDRFSIVMLLKTFCLTCYRLGKVEAGNTVAIHIGKQTTSELHHYIQDLVIIKRGEREEKTSIKEP